MRQKQKSTSKIILTFISIFRDEKTEDPTPFRENLEVEPGLNSHVPYS